MAECHCDMKEFWRLLAEGLCSGRQLLSLLNDIASKIPAEPLGNAVTALAEDVADGKSLSQAMSKLPRVFSPAHVSLVDGSERLGIIDRVVLLILESTWRCPQCGNLAYPQEES